MKPITIFENFNDYNFKVGDVVRSRPNFVSSCGKDRYIIEDIVNGAAYKKNTIWNGNIFELDKEYLRKNKLERIIGL